MGRSGEEHGHFFSLQTMCPKDIHLFKFCISSPCQGLQVGPRASSWFVSYPWAVWTAQLGWHCWGLPLVFLLLPLGQLDPCPVWPPPPPCLITQLSVQPFGLWSLTVPSHPHLAASHRSPWGGSPPSGSWRPSFPALRRHDSTGCSDRLA